MKQENLILSNSNSKELRPYEKCYELGAESLTDTQLMAVILRVGTNGIDATKLSEQIFECGDGTLNGVMHLTIEELMQVKGVGRVKAIQIRCICELAKRISKQTAAYRLDYSSADTIAQYYMQDMRFLEKEHLVLILLDNKCKCIRDCVLSVGSVNASLIDTRQIFIEALRYKAVSVILLHNHPSGDPTPSQNDIFVTKKVFDAGKLIGINLLDHIIIGDNRFISIKEQGYI